jgi:hypothetical protein
MNETEDVYREDVKVQPWTASSYEELENIRKRASYDLRYAYAVKKLTLNEIAFELCNGHSVQFYNGDSRFVVLRLTNASALADKALPPNVAVAGEYIIKQLDIELGTTGAYGMAAHEFRRELEKLGIPSTTDIYYPNPDKPFLGCNGFAATLFGAVVAGESKWYGCESDKFVLSRTYLVGDNGNPSWVTFIGVSTLIYDPMPTSMTDLICHAPKDNHIHRYRGKNWTVCQNDSAKQVAYKLVGLALLADIYGLGQFTEDQFDAAIAAHEFARVTRLNVVKKRDEQPYLADAISARAIVLQYYFNKNLADRTPFYAAGRISYSQYAAKHGQRLRNFRPRGGSSKRKLSICKKAKTMADKAKSASCSLRTLYNHGVRSSRQTNISQILDALDNNGVYVYQGSLPNAKRQAIKRYNQQHPESPIALVKIKR